MKTKKLIFKILLGLLSIGVFLSYVFLLFPWALQLIMPWSHRHDWVTLFYFLTVAFSCLMLLCFGLALSDSDGKISLVYVRGNVLMILLACVTLFFLAIVHGSIPFAFFIDNVVSFRVEFSYFIVSLVLGCLLFFLTFCVLKLWERIGKIKTVEKSTVKKQVVLQEVKKPLPKPNENKKKILFISDLSEDNQLYQLVRNSTRKYELTTRTSRNIPSDLSEFALVIVHYVAGFTFSDSLLNKKKIIIPTPTTRKERTSPKNSTVFEQRKGAPVNGHSLEMEIQLLIK